MEEVLDAGAYVSGVGDEEGVKVLLERWPGAGLEGRHGRG